MSEFPSQGRARARTRTRAAAAWLVASLVASVTVMTAISSPSSAGITTPDAGAVLRDEGPVTINENRGGQYTGSNAQLCGLTVANRPSSTITVTRLSDGVVVHSAASNTAPGFTQNASNANGPYSTVWNTTGAQPGDYRIVSKAVDRNRTNLGVCSTVAEQTLSDITVSFRPWQHSNFNDLLGHGTVRMNTTPGEFQWTVDGTVSPIVSNPTANQARYFASPEGLVTLPSDPGACSGNVLSCLPDLSVECTQPLSPNCVPRIVVLDYTKGGPFKDRMFGIFDLETGAFAAFAQTGGKTRILASAGTDVDDIVADLIAATAATGQEVTGADVLALLSTTLELRLRQGAAIRSFEVGALRGLQISKMFEAGPNAVNILAPYTVNAGIISHTTGAFTYPEANPDGYGFTVTESTLVPNLPTLFSLSLGGGSADVLALAPLPAPLDELGSSLLLGGGPLVNIHGKYPAGAATHKAGSTGFGPNVDTAPDSPDGLPIWLPSQNDNVTLPSSSPMDFVGHAALFLEFGSLIPGVNSPALCLLGTCTYLGNLIVGNGVAVYGDSPLPPLAELPLLWDTANPVAAQLNELTAGGLLTNPAVAAVVTAALALVGGGTPDLGTVTDVLSDLSTFGDLVSAVSGPLGLAAVPGLEAAIDSVLGTAETVVTSPPAASLLATILGLLSL